MERLASRPAPAKTELLINFQVQKVEVVPIVKTARSPE